LWLRRFAALHTDVEELMCLLRTHATPSDDGTVTKGVGAVLRAAAEALRAAALAAGGGDDEDAHVSHAKALVAGLLASARSLSAEEARSPWVGGGPERMHACPDQPIYRCWRLYLQLRGEMAKRVLFPAGLHCEMGQAESIAHSLKPLGLDAVVQVTSMTTMEALIKCHEDIERALVVYRAMGAALRLHAWMTFIRAATGTTATHLDAARAVARMEMTVAGGAAIHVWTADFCGILEAEEAPVWLERACNGAAVALRCRSRVWTLAASQPREAVMKDLVRIAAECVALATAAVLDTHYEWMFAESAVNPTAAAVLQLMSLIAVLLLYHEMTRAGPTCVAELATMEGFGMCLFATDTHKAKYQEVSVAYALD
jgi:hypothetical protein